MLEISIKLIGPPGSGKTRAARAIAKALYNIIPGFPYDVEILSANDGETEPTLELRGTQVALGAGLSYRQQNGDK